MYTKNKMEKYSYSKINAYLTCPFKFFLTYVKGHYIDSSNINTYFGTLVHWIEQRIAMSILADEKINYEQLKEDFLNVNIPRTGRGNSGEKFGVNVLKRMYPDEFFSVDGDGRSFDSKSKEYLDTGIYRLENYLKANPQLELKDTEKYFCLEFEDVLLTGSIDRVLFNKDTQKYIIEDIKTKAKPFDDKETVTPLQAVIYSYALKNVLGLSYYPTDFDYDLPFCDIRQEAGTPGFIERGLNKIRETLREIKACDFQSHGSPLCHWCGFCPTNPDQPEDGKLLCPYYSLWTRENKTFKVAHTWKGMEKHEEIMKKEIAEQAKKAVKKELPSSENDNQELDF